tara:strand:+ start:834 stop:1106 length:273 start_codon:yes stop_codon:yes gene_type:complete
MMVKIHYVSSRIGGVRKYQAFRDSCARQISESSEGRLHLDDLFSNLMTKKGTPMRCGIPIRKGVHNVLRTDERFVCEGKGVYSLLKEVEA